MLMFDQTLVEKPSFSPRHLTEWVIDWPVEFYVCERCKYDFFFEYEDALVCDDDRCVLCNPLNNDSLGG